MFPLEGGDPLKKAKKKKKQNSQVDESELIVDKALLEPDPTNFDQEAPSEWFQRVQELHNALIKDEITVKGKRELFLQAAEHLVNKVVIPQRGAASSSTIGTEKVEEVVQVSRVSECVAHAVETKPICNAVSTIPFVLDTGQGIELMANFTVKKTTMQSSRRSRMDAKSRTQIDEIFEKHQELRVAAEKGLVGSAVKMIRRVESLQSYRIFYCAFVIVSSALNVYVTMPQCSDEQERVLKFFDLVFNLLFTFELIAHILTDHRQSDVKHMLYLCIDFFAVLPFYVYFCLGVSHDSSWWMELLYVLMPPLRLFKLTRRSQSWQILVQALQNALSPICVPGFFVLLIMGISSSIIYLVEKYNAPEDVPSSFTSLPYTMWFALVTASTVGYGDVYPKTDFGRMCTVLMIVTSVCCFAMPLTIIGNSFAHVWENRDMILLTAKMRETLNQEELGAEEVMTLFQLLDCNGNGYLTIREFSLLGERLHLGLTKKELDKVFNSIDKDGSGDVTFDEFHHSLFPWYRKVNNE